MANFLRAAFSGAGTLGLIHGGAICAYIDNDYSFQQAAGSSAGSIAASLIAAGFTSAEIRGFCMSAMPDGILSANLFDLPFDDAVNTGEIMEKWLHDVLGDITFAQAKVPITILATDINARKSYAMNKNVCPDTPLYQACRASSSVPFMFEPYMLNDRKFVDAGVACNMPLNHLVMDEIPIVGIEIMDSSPASITSNVASLAKACIQTMLQSNEGNLVAWGKMFAAKIIQIDATPYGFLDPSLPLSAKEDLFNRGYSAVQKALV